MRILVTGASGFVGRHLCDYATGSGAEVVGVGHRKSAAGPGVAEAITADLLDSDAAKRVVREAAPDRVFHLAGSASVAESWREPGRTAELNVTSWVNVLQAVLAAGRECRVLLASSGEVYGRVDPAALPVDEEHRLAPENPYGVTKATAEAMADVLTREAGPHLVCARAFNHAGPGQSETFVLPSFARRIAEAELEGASDLELQTGNLQVRRDFCDVRDVVRAYWDALDAAPPGVYNVCAGESVEIASILSHLQDLTSVRVHQRTSPDLVRAAEVMDIRGSHERLTRATGWQPEIGLRQTVADTLDWWRAELGVAA